MPWAEFSTFLTGLNGDTPLGNIVRIRSERDRAAIKRFSKEERRIHNQWRQRRAQTVTRSEYEAQMASLSAMFRGLAQDDDERR
jgi:hypothetical protein